MSHTPYGAATDQSPADRTRVVRGALDRFAHSRHTPADKIILWFDCALDAAWIENEKLKSQIRQTELKHGEMEERKDEEIEGLNNALEGALSEIQDLSD